MYIQNYIIIITTLLQQKNLIHFLILYCLWSVGIYPGYPLRWLGGGWSLACHTFHPRLGSCGRKRWWQCRMQGERRWLELPCPSCRMSLQQVGYKPIPAQSTWGHWLCVFASLPKKIVIMIKRQCPSTDESRAVKSVSWQAWSMYSSALSDHHLGNSGSKSSNTWISDGHA